MAIKRRFGVKFDRKMKKKILLINCLKGFTAPSIMTLRITTFSIMTHNIMPFSMITHSIMSDTITTLSIMELNTVILGVVC